MYGLHIAGHTETDKLIGNFISNQTVHEIPASIWSKRLTKAISRVIVAPTPNSLEDKMRSFISSILFLFSTTFAQAAIEHDAIQELAYAGDFESVDVAIAEAHQQSLTGEISYDALRDLLGVLTRTHPDMDDFRALWLENLPESPYAQMATAWSLYNDSFAVRGTAFVRDTPPAARMAFQELQRDAVALTVRAYDTAPDFVPASDGIIVMQQSAGIMMNWLFHFVVKDIMEATPGFGTLERLSMHANVNWGGRGLQEIVDLCETYSDKIPEYPDMTYEICLVALLAHNDMLEGSWPFVAGVLDREDHALLTLARVKRALVRRTDEDYQIVMDYLDNTRFDYRWIEEPYRIARRFAVMQWDAGNQEIKDFLTDFQLRLRAELMTELARNPFDLSLLEMIIRDDLQLYALIRADALEVQNYKLRRAVLQPYHLQNWADAVERNADLGNPSFLNTLDIPLYNAIAYSDYRLSAITNLLSKKLEQYRRFRDPDGTHGFAAWPEQPEEALIRETGCRAATLIRLFEDAATREPERVNTIEGFRINQNLDAIEAELQTFSACDYVWDAPIEQLKFEPIELDRRELMVIPTSSPFVPSLESFEAARPNAKP